MYKFVRVLIKVTSLQSRSMVLAVNFVMNRYLLIMSNNLYEWSIHTKSI